MKTVVKRLLPLMIMMVLLVLVVSLLPQNGTVDSSARVEQSAESMDSVALTVLETRVD